MPSSHLHNFFASAKTRLPFRHPLLKTSKGPVSTGPLFLCPPFERRARRPMWSPHQENGADMADVEIKSRKLQVATMRPDDSGRGIARLPRAIMAELGL